MSPTLLALSIRQPWAGLIVAGRKSIEVRTWPTAHRGPLLVHASKVRDERPEATQWVTPAVAPFCELTGGVIGLVDLIECRDYRTPPEFLADRAAHLNAPHWFQLQGLFGFRLANPVRVTFFPCSGQTRLFHVTGFEMPRIIFPPETAP